MYHAPWPVWLGFRNSSNHNEMAEDHLDFFHSLCDCDRILYQDYSTKLLNEAVSDQEIFSYPKRLEFISACSFLHDKGTLLKFLPIAPASLFPALFDAALRLFFEDLGSTPCLQDLLEHWPLEIFCLRDMLPALPVLCNSLTFDTQKIADAKLTFRKTVVDWLCAFSLQNFSLLNAIHVIDLSGLTRMQSESFNENVWNELEMTLVESSRVKEITLIIDVTIERSTLRRAIQEGTHCLLPRLQPFLRGPLVVQIACLFVGPLRHETWPLIFEIVVQHQVQFLSLDLMRFSLSPLGGHSADGLIPWCHHLTGFTLTLSEFHHVGLNGLTFLTSMPHLQELTLSYVNLTGRLGFLNLLQQNLRSLQFHRCTLSTDDIHFLATTAHASSVEHFSLIFDKSYYQLSQAWEEEEEEVWGQEEEEQVKALLLLCRTLLQVKVLDLDFVLGKMWTSASLTVFTHLASALATLPMLSVLTLLMCNNDHISALQDSQNLRCLRVRVIYLYPEF